nr:ribonuclease H-like domain, reverse transcriptase, RNA-dependent DNA polymerase [Tanacetum cinerariifolium]
MPPKHDLSLIDEHFESVSVDVISNITPSDVKTVKTIDVNHKGVFSTEEPKPVMKNNFSPLIIEDWHSDDESEVDISPTVEGNLQQKEYKENGVIDSGCSKHMTGNKCYLTDFEAYNGGFVSFGDGKGRISGKALTTYNSLKTFSPNNTAGSKAVSAVKGNGVTAVKTSAEKEVDMKNVDSSYTILEDTKFLKDHPQEQVIGSLETPVQTRQMSKTHEEFGLLSSVHKLRRTNHKDFQNCMFACYLSQMEPKKPVQALRDPSWVEAMHDELLQFKLLKVWTLVNLPKDKWAIDTIWVYKNKKDERRIVIKNKARLVAQGHTQEEGIDYDEVFALVARIKAIRLFLAYASFKDFVVYQMDVKSAFLYGRIENEVYVSQPSGFEDPNFPDKVYKVEKALYGLYQAPRASSTLMESNNPLIKDEKAEDVDVHLYISMISSLMYLTASRPDITFAVCACARFQVTLKISHLYAVKRIFSYLKGKPKLGLWYPKDLPFDLEDYFNSDYAGASLDRKSTTGGCQFFGKRLISWQCKKQTIVANSTTEAEYVAAANCCGQEIDQNAEIALDDETQGMTNDDEMFGVNDLAGEEVVMDTTTGEHEEKIIEDVSTVEPVTTAGEVVTTTIVKDSAATTDVTEDEITMAQSLVALKTTKPKVMVQEQQMSTTIPAVATKFTTAVPTPRAKGKAKMIKPEVPIKKKDHMRIDEEYARKLEAKKQEAARLSKAQKDKEAKNSWDNIQAMIDVDILLPERLQAREREEFSKVQKARLLVELIKKRKKHFAALRA